MTTRTSRVSPWENTGVNGRDGAGWDRALAAVLSYLPPEIGGKILKMPVPVREGLEEIRLRAERPLAVTLGDADLFLSEEGQVTPLAAEGWVVPVSLVERTVQLMARSSFYALEEDLRRGFLTLPGGHRVGLTGQVVQGIEAGEPGVRGIRAFGGVNIRLAREVPGAADRVLPYLFDQQGRPFSTLVISSPRAGKTTLLRDLARQFSDGDAAKGRTGVKVALVDERSELAGCESGVPQYRVGARTDVLDRCPKAQGIMMLVRAMSPQVVITDEIGGVEDVAAVQEACHSGVAVVASAHAADLEDARRRIFLHRLLKGGHLDRVVVLSRRSGPGTLESVVDMTRGEYVWQREG